MWQVRLDQKVIKYIRGTPPDVYDSYINAIDSVFEFAEMCDRHPITICAGGFLVEVKGQNAALRCMIDEDKHQFYVFGIKFLK